MRVVTVVVPLRLRGPRSPSPRSRKPHRRVHPGIS